MIQELLFTSMLLCILGAPDVTNDKFPVEVTLINMNGDSICSSELTNDGKILMIDFWQTYCGSCIKMLNAVSNNYDMWNSKTNCKIIAIANQKPDEKTLEFIKKKDWPFEIYFDPEYNLFKELKNRINKVDSNFAFPTVFIFNADYELIDNFSGTKEIWPDGHPPVYQEGKIIQDNRVIDLNYYYDLFKNWNKE